MDRHVLFWVGSGGAMANMAMWVHVSYVRGTAPGQLNICRFNETDPASWNLS